MTDKFGICVSAVVPAYNAEKYISETIYSLIAQTYPLHEIIVIDDCSTDGTYAAVKTLKKDTPIPIKLIKNANNLGVSASRNAGMANAQGDWILFMDSDDIAEPNLVERECEKLRELKKNTQDNWILVYPAYRQMDENGKVLSQVMRGKQLEAGEAFGYEIVRNHIITPSGLMLCKGVAIKSGGFRTGLKYQIEDWELWLRIAGTGGFAYIDEPLVRVRRHSANATKNMNKALLAELEVLKNYDIADIKAEIYSRKLPKSRNLADYVSVLYKLDYWNLGFEELCCIDTNEINDGIMFMKGLYYVKKMSFDSARKCFERVIELNDRHGAAINNLGILHALYGKTDEARSNFDKALKLYPGYIDAYNNFRLLESKEGLNRDNCRFTWRELRPVLLYYSE